MAKEEQGPDALARSIYILTIVGIVLYCGAVILFVL